MSCIGRRLFSHSGLVGRGAGRPLSVQIAGSWLGRIGDAPRVISSGVLVGTLGSRILGFLGCGFLTFLGFSLGSVLVISKGCWKVLSSVRGWGGP